MHLTKAALFIVPFLQTVFGIECALRSLRRLPFQARGKYDVVICSFVVVVMTVGVWIISHVTPEPDSCFASLIWYVSAFGFEGMIIFSVCSGLMLISAMVIFIRLSSVNMIDQHQRIAASRMVYYLVLGMVSLVRLLCSNLNSNQLTYSRLLLYRTLFRKQLATEILKPRW